MPSSKIGQRLQVKQPLKTMCQMQRQPQCQVQRMPNPHTDQIGPKRGNSYQEANDGDKA